MHDDFMPIDFRTLEPKWLRSVDEPRRDETTIARLRALLEPKMATEIFFFARPTLSVRTLKTVAVASSREVPVLGSVPGVSMRIPHPKPLARSSGRRPGFSCGSPQTAPACEQRLASHGPHRTLLVRLVCRTFHGLQHLAPGAAENNRKAKEPVACTVVDGCHSQKCSRLSAWAHRHQEISLRCSRARTISDTSRIRLAASTSWKSVSAACRARHDLGHVEKVHRGRFLLILLVFQLMLHSQLVIPKPPDSNSARQHPGAFARAQAQARHGGKASFSCMPEPEYATHHVAWSDGQ